jgi:hypothetical protein
LNPTTILQLGVYKATSVHQEDANAFTLTTCTKNYNFHKFEYKIVKLNKDLQRLKIDTKVLV